MNEIDPLLKALDNSHSLRKELSNLVGLGYFDDKNTPGINNQLEKVNLIFDNLHSNIDELSPKKYGIHIIGPNDIKGPYSKQEAHKEANEINLYECKLILENNPNNPHIMAIVFEWDNYNYKYQ